MADNRPSLADLPIPLERDGFLRLLLRHLAGALQEVVGLDEAEGFVSIVGQRIGDELNTRYKQALAVPQLTREQVADVLVDLKRRINGSFYIIEEHEDRIVLGNQHCPFGDKVVDRPALCMMTSNVFGGITADNLGYARVVLDRTIARGDDGCRVTIHLTPADAASASSGREYFKS